MIEVKMPAGPQDLRIKNFSSMQHIPEGGFKNAKDSILFLAEFTGLQYGQILDFTSSDVIKMTSLAIKALSKMDLVSKLPTEIVLKGETFELVDPEKIGIGWHIDFEGCNIQKDPVRLACLFYVQKDFNYSTVDENGNILYPISSRYKLFKEEFPLDLFIRSSNFFLKRSLTSIKRSMAIGIAKSKAKNKISFLLRSLNLFNGRLQSKQS